LPNDDRGIDAGACFGSCGNVFTCGCLAMDEFSVSAIPAFNCHDTMLSHPRLVLPNSLPSGFVTAIFMNFAFLQCGPGPSHPSDLNTLISGGSLSLCRLLQSSVTSSLMRPNILLNTILSTTLNTCTCRSVKDQDSQPNNTTAMTLCIVIVKLS
jgi:hypothetical protein